MNRVILMGRLTRDPVIKGTRAMIVSSGSSFFIENIDKMVEDYLANPY